MPVLMPPENFVYTNTGWTTANCPWECINGLAKTAINTCGARCDGEFTTLRTSTGIIVPLFANKNTISSIYLQYNDTICYADLVEGSVSGEINVLYGEKTFHTVKKQQ